MRMSKLLVGLLMLGLSAPALATDPPKTEKKADPDRIVCKVDRSTGSMISDRICKKKSEWQEDKFQARDLMDNLNRGPGHRPPTGGSGG